MLDSERLTCLATEAGLDLVGAVPVRPSPGWQAYADWAAAGYAADMAYLTRPESVEKRRDPRSVMPTAKSVLVVAVSYAGPVAPALDGPRGRVARYAWRADYHVWLLARLKHLVRLIEAETGVPVQSRCYVDTGPVLERAWAQAAGLGWLGRNGLIHPVLGSFLRWAWRSGYCTADCRSTTSHVWKLRGLSRGLPDRRTPGPRCPGRAPLPIVPDHRASRRRRICFTPGDPGCGQDVCPWNRKPTGDHKPVTAPAQATLRPA